MPVLRGSGWFGWLKGKLFAGIASTRSALANSGCSAFCASTDPRPDAPAAVPAIAVPLLDQGKAVGILEVFSGTAHAFDDNDIRHLHLLAKMTVEAMAH